MLVSLQNQLINVAWDSSASSPHPVNSQSSRVEVIFQDCSAAVQVRGL